MTVNGLGGEGASARPRAMRGWRAALALLVLLPGCTLSWLYDHADWLVERRIDAWVDLSTPQREWLDGAFGRLWRWHRAEALPAWARLLQGARDRFEDGLDAADVAWIERGVQKQTRALVVKVLPEAVHLLRDLGPAQVARVAERAEEQADDEREDLALPEAERLSRRADTMVGFVEDLVGDLGDDQEAALRLQIRGLPLEDTAQAAQAAERRAALLAALRGDRGRLPEQLRAWLLDDPVGPSPEWRDGARRMVIALDASLTAGQRLTAIGRIDRVIAELRKLHAQR